jgi:hypothetical protein
MSRSVSVSGRALADLECERKAHIAAQFFGDGRSHSAAIRTKREHMSNRPEKTLGVILSVGNQTDRWEFWRLLGTAAG